MTSRTKNYLGAIIVALAILLSMYLKIVTSTLGYNPDVESWKIAGDIVLDGKSVYAHTNRYNYGPLWSYVLGFLNNFALKNGHSTISQFHTYVVALLTLVDCAIAYFIFKLFGKRPALLFLLNPITILLTGYHSQFDNVAVLFGLIGWYLYTHKKSTHSSYLFWGSAFFFGISLIFKHILILFPVWLLFSSYHKDKKLLLKISHVVVIYLLFFMSFRVEEYLHPNERLPIVNGVKQFVFGYKGPSGHSALLNVLELFVPVGYVGNFLDKMPVVKGYTFLFFSLVTMYGFFTRKRLGSTLYYFPVYLLAFFSFSTSMADQYIAISLLPIAIFAYRPEVILFNIATFVYLARGPSANISNFQTYSMELFLYGHRVPFFPWNLIYKFNGLQVQMWALLLTVNLLIDFKFKDEILPQLLELLRIAKSILKKVTDIYKNNLAKINYAVFAFLGLMLCAYFYNKIMLRPSDKIRVVEATYGGNCTVATGNVTKETSKRCDGLASCDLKIDYTDPVPGCAKNFKVYWTCTTVQYFFPAYFIRIEPEALGTTVKLVCPAERYSESFRLK